MNFLSEAFGQAAYAIGNSDPNPPVGAILVNESGAVIGRGYTQIPGKSHAEVMAIEEARKISGDEAIAGSSLFVTLEPCSHFGRTPPCTDLILRSKIKNVTIAIEDPTEKVQGIEVLKSNGIHVEVAERSDFSQELFWTLDGFAFAEKNGRPRVFLKWAQDANGWLAPENGAGDMISGKLAREVVYRLRKMNHSILVTPGTVFYDRPALTARYGEVSLKDVLSTDYFSRALLAFENGYPEMYRGNQKRFIMIPDLSESWSLSDIINYAAFQSQLPGSVYFIVNNQKSLEVLERAGFQTHFERDFSNLESILKFIYLKGSLNVLIEAGPVFCEVLMKSGFVDYLFAIKSKAVKWDKGRGFSGSLALVPKKEEYVIQNRYRISNYFDLGSDEFFFFK